jgi:hypothetical protein
VRGGYFAFLKMAPNLDNCAFEEGPLRPINKCHICLIGAAPLLEGGDSAFAKFVHSFTF